MDQRGYERSRLSFIYKRIYYRIPDIAEVEIQDGGKPVFNERIPVYQYGTVITMPVFK